MLSVVSVVPGSPELTKAAQRWVARGLGLEMETERPWVGVGEANPAYWL